MNQCSVCVSRRFPAIEAALSTRRSTRGISKEFGVSYDSLLRHVRNGHSSSRSHPSSRRVAPHPALSRSPHRVWKFSAEEVAHYDRVDAEWNTRVSTLTGISADVIGSHDVRSHPAEMTWDEVIAACATCHAIGEHEDMWTTVAELVEKRDGKPTLGHWMT